MILTKNPGFFKNSWIPQFLEERNKNDSDLALVAQDFYQIFMDYDNSIIDFETKNFYLDRAWNDFKSSLVYNNEKKRYWVFEAYLFLINYKPRPVFWPPDPQL